MPFRSAAALVALGTILLVVLIHLLGLAGGIGPALAVGIGAAIGGWLGWSKAESPRRPWPPRP